MKSKKVIDIDSGRWMVVADLHGNLEDYQRAKEIFVKNKEKGTLEGIIFAGDTIHSFSENERSKEILDDIISLKGKYGNSVMPLLGNHDLSSIYNYVLKSKTEEGTAIFGSDFEHQIKGEKEKYTDFLKSFAIAVRTKGGLIINHAGPTSAIDYFEEDVYKSHLEQVTAIDHDAILKENKESWDDLEEEEKENFKEKIVSSILKMPYDKVLELLAISPEDKERYEDLIHGYYFVTRNVDGKWLNSMLTNTDLSRLDDFFKIMSDENYKPEILLQGHIHPSAGISKSGDRNTLCFTSSEGADISSKKIAIIEAEKKYGLEDLAKSIVPLYSQKLIALKITESLNMLGAVIEKYPSLKSQLLENDETLGKTVMHVDNLVLDNETNQTLVYLLKVLESKDTVISNLKSTDKFYTLEYNHPDMIGSFKVEGNNVLEEDLDGSIAKLVRDGRTFKFKEYKSSVLAEDSKLEITV